MKTSNWPWVFVAAAVVAALVLATGCKTVTENVDGDTVPAYNPRDFVPERDQEAMRNPQQKTSLWAEANRENWLFTDHKARTVNDIVTIDIYESSKAKKKAKTTLGKDNEADLGITGLFGLENVVPRFSPEVNMGSLIGAGTSRSFKGTGETERSGELVAKMSAMVTQVLPNGNLMIEGKRLVRVNNEEQVMVLSGVIRTRDVTASNTIPSYMIADAKIYYAGRGVIADKQKPGWLSRGLDKIEPF